MADVGDRDQVAEIVRAAERAFGGFDAWVNNAGTGTFGKVLDTPFDDMRKVFETNFWGVVYGSVLAIEHFGTRPGGGKLINMGSVLGDFGVPEQGPYVAAKHAVKGFTNTLRTEVIRDRLPVSITLIKPSAISTPFKDHARNYMDSPARLPPPVYAPDLVADAVLYAAQHHVRDLTVGSAGRGQALFQQVFPGLADRAFAAFGPALQKDLRPDQRIVREGNLFVPGADGEERTDLRFVREHSLYTAAQTHPRATAAAVLLAGVVAAGALVSFGRARNA